MNESQQEVADIVMSTKIASILDDEARRRELANLAKSALEGERMEGDNDVVDY